MTEDDVPMVLAIEHQAYVFPWTEGIFRDCLRVGYHCRILEREGAIIAYGISSIAAGESHILNLCVRPSQRRQGLGRLMLNYLMDEAQRSRVEMMLLEVRVSNVAAIRMYQQAGFNEIGLRQNYYPAENGKEDALLMARAFQEGLDVD
jgi:ribosomal-protein-alanine N-acetyltransferase